MPAASPPGEVGERPSGIAGISGFAADVLSVCAREVKKKREVRWIRRAIHNRQKTWQKKVAR